MSAPIRLPDGRTPGQVLYLALRGALPDDLVEIWAEQVRLFPDAYCGRCEAAAQAVLAADPARAQALAALERAELGYRNLIHYGNLDWTQQGEALALARELRAAIAALKGGGK